MYTKHSPYKLIIGFIGKIVNSFTFLFSNALSKSPCYAGFPGGFAAVQAKVGFPNINKKLTVYAMFEQNSFCYMFYMYFYLVKFSLTSNYLKKISPFIVLDLHFFVV